MATTLFALKLDRSGQEIEVPVGVSILDALELAGVYRSLGVPRG